MLIVDSEKRTGNKGTYVMFYDKNKQREWNSNRVQSPNIGGHPKERKHETNSRQDLSLPSFGECLT